MNGNGCFLIDSGKSMELKDEILKYLLDNNLKLKAIINTHCHSDHVSNDDICDCKVLASDLEKTIIENSGLQLDILYGGKHPNFMESCFVASKSFNTSDLERIENINYINLSGHSYNMIGVCVEGKVLYIGDAIYSEREINKIPYTYDVEKFLNSLEELKKYDNKIIISSHIGIIDNIDELIKFNKLYVENMINIILDICKSKKTFDNIIELVCEKKCINLSIENYFLISSSIKSFLSYLIDKDLIKVQFFNYNLYYEVNL